MTRYLRPITLYLFSSMVFLCGCQDPRVQEELISLRQENDSLRTVNGQLSATILTLQSSVPAGDDGSMSQSENDVPVSGRIAHDDFRKLMMGRTKESVKAILGKPNSVSDEDGRGKVYWTYSRDQNGWQTYDPDASESDYGVQLFFTASGKVRDFVFF